MLLLTELGSLDIPAFHCVFREAANYIHQLVAHLETSDGTDAIAKFPQIFLEERQTKTVNYCTPVNSSSVTAFISRHDLPEEPNHISILTPIVP
ncbi:hypothetical protein B9Z55_015342 [Caenorhabditis nigoni]|uniref:Uncharacterized protein n=1 Tax=Caenorhabditis nigoni TaxID=1611254 RepID=A0A2G5U9Q3_9PELO|nr:hypothetical protein B9Z55_015342 [Caenorhabditis nigoni]